MIRRDALLLLLALLLSGGEVFAGGPPRRRCVIIDVDNTLVDKRPTTIAAARRYSWLAGQPRLAKLRLRDVRWDGYQTARAVGLGHRAASRFQRYWDKYFWTPTKFIKHDAPIDPVIKATKAAKAAGCEVFYVTGRWKRYKDATMTQLKKHGLPDVDRRHVICKPESMQTGAFKTAAVNSIRRRHDVLWFASDTHVDINAVQPSGVPCVLVDISVKQPGQPRLLRPTPTIKIR